MSSFMSRSRDVIAMNDRRNKRRKKIILALGCVAGAFLLCAIVRFVVINFKYNGYKVVKTTTLKNSQAMEFEAYDGGVLRYSRDGVVAMESTGEDVWNGSYEMDNPRANVCKTSVTVADIGGKKAFAYTPGKGEALLDMDYSILQACISRQGVLAVLLEDTASNVIQLYDPFADNNKLLAEIPTNIEQGYPVAFDISNDGTGVVAAYVAINDGKVTSRVAFYNFTNVGENTNCLVGAQEYKDLLVSEVRYIDDSSAVVFSDKGFSVWKNLKKPKMSFERKFKRKIKHAFCDEGYIGVITGTDREKEDDMCIYNKNGRRTLNRKIGGQYSHVGMYGDEVYLTSAEKCCIYRANGVKKLDCRIKGSLMYIYPTAGIRNYIFLSEKSMNKIKLRKG